MKENKRIRCKVLESQGGFFKVCVNGTMHLLEASKKVQKTHGEIITGDYVLCDFENSYIYDVEKRKNSFIRPKIANVDCVCILMSAVEPEYDTYLLDKFIAYFELSHVEIVIVFTKLDRCDEHRKQEVEELLQHYTKIGYTTFTTQTPANVEEIKSFLKEKTSVFMGQTGVGKSTLINRLDTTLNIETQAISHALGRGKHTTRTVTLRPFLDGLLADTPGFSDLDSAVYGITQSKLRYAFREFEPYAEECKFRDCLHRNEPKCAVIEAVETGAIAQTRYDNYQKIFDELPKEEWKI